MKAFFFIVFATLVSFTLIILMSKPPILIIDTPITFNQERIDLTKSYIKEHYDLNVSHITINPKMIVLHWTEDANVTKCFELFNPESIQAELLTQHANIVKQAGQLNVSAHFLIDKKGHIFRLMPESQMARHVIGLNYHAIGIENVGGVTDNGHAQADLTPAQVRANIELVAYLKKKFPKIEYLIGHYEYTNFEKHPLWMEKDDNYRTTKDDPNPQFVDEIYTEISDLQLKRQP